MYKITPFLFVLFICGTSFVNAATDTIRVYSENDGITQLFDEDNQTIWTSARNYIGAIYRDPIEDEDHLSLRSDKNSGKYRIYRASAVFDTSIIPDDVQIESVSLHLYGTAGTAGLVVTDHNRSSNNFLIKDDWYISNYGTAEFARADLINGEYVELVFSSSGITNVKTDNATVLGFLTDNDFDNIDPGSATYFRAFASVEAAGTSTDPYLEITYTYDDGEPETDDSLFTQVESPYPSQTETASWANDTYAWGDDYWCGTTIAGCGCAITSLVMMGRESGVLRGVDGSDVNPGNFNAWLQANAGYDSAGSLFWTKAAEYLGENVDGRVATSFSVEKFRAQQPLELRAAVADSNLRVIGYNGAKYHFFYLTGLNFSGYDVHDPFWYKTRTTNDSKNVAGHVQDYNDEVDRGVIYRVETPAIQTGIIEATLNSPGELLLVDGNGKRTGYVAASGVVEEIPHSGYVQDDVIGSRDDGATPPHVTKHLLATKGSGQYELHIIGTGGGPYVLSVLLKDEAGYEHRFEYHGQTSLDQEDVFIIDLSTGAVEQVAVDRAMLLAAVSAATAHATDEEQRFFVRWANKIFDEIEADKDSQASQHLDVFELLQEAKDVTSNWLQQVVAKLKQQLESEEV